MSLLLHAIVPREACAAPNGSLVRLDTASLSAIASASEVDMLAHHRIVVQLHHACGACLPARFGTWLDEETLRELLADKQEQVRAALERVRGRSELAVTALWKEPPGRTSGTEYLRAKQRELALADLIEHELAPLAVASQASPASRAEVAASVALLVPSEQVLNVAEQARGLSLGDDVRILVSGPWPPYSFARLGPAEE